MDENISKEMERHIKCLDNIVRRSGEYLEGNCVYENLTYNRDPRTENKRINLFNLSKGSKYILEIGFNAGHSCLLYLLSNPSSHIFLFDIGEHRYTHACFEYLDREFPNRMTIIYGDSMVTVPSCARNIMFKFDLIHIDGGHSREIAYSDITNCKEFSHKNTIGVFDDLDIPDLGRLFVELVNKDFIVPYTYDILETTLHPHGIFKWKH